MTRDQFIYALTACGCLLKDGKTWYEHNELIKCFEDLGLFEQEPVLDKYQTEEAEAHPINENITKGFEEFTKMMFRQGQGRK